MEIHVETTGPNYVFVENDKKLYAWKPIEAAPGFWLGAAEVGAEIFLLEGTTKQRLQRLDLRALLAVKDRQLFLSQLAVQEDGSCVQIMWSSYGTRTSLAG